MKPSLTFSQTTADEKNEISCPREIQHISVNVTSNLIAEHRHGTNNLADEMQTLCSDVPRSEFVRHVSFTSGHAPCVVFFTDEQMSDIKRFCGANAPDSIRSVFCVDRTFNVSSLFLTVTVFKNNSVLQNKAMQAPIFLVQCFCMATVLT